MKFYRDGADIPDELIRTFLKGEGIFLCGAGVSMRAGLPSFRCLVDDVYGTLGESLDHDPAERHAYDRKEYDRALRSLEKRISPPQEGASKVRIAVEQKLQPPAASGFPDHLNLLKISKNRAGRPRVLTTNFDTLFERAADSEWPPGIPSHGGKAQPSAGKPTDHGVLHLHGRLADCTLSLSVTDLVLTSSDFGSAYLRDGWASRYIEDRMRLDIIVLVGYGADDVAVRLLMETLDADRDRFSDLKKVYVIDCRGKDSHALWRAKGIIPIEFSEDDFAGMYQTIGEWAKFADAPADYAKALLVSYLSMPPEKLDVAQADQLSFLLETFGADRVLVELEPTMAWLLRVVELGVVNWNSHAVGVWITRHLGDAATLGQIAANVDRLNEGTAQQLEFQLEEASELPKWMRESWRLIVRHIRNWSNSSIESDWFQIRPRVASGDRSPDAMQTLAELMRPKLKVRKRFGLDDADGEPTRPSDVMAIELVPNSEASHTEFLEIWPETAPAEDDARLLGYLTANLDQALDGAVDLGLDSYEGTGLTDYDVPSVADHGQNEHRSGFLPIVRAIADLWRRLAEKEPKAAKEFFVEWSVSRHKLKRRLALFAAAHPVIEAGEAAQFAAEMDPGEFYLTEAEVEYFRLLSTRWHEFSPEECARIEQRMREGPLADRSREDADAQHDIDRCLYDMLSALDKSGCVLSQISLKLRDAIQEKHKHWTPLEIERIGFKIWMDGGWTGTIGDPDKLGGVSSDLLVETAMRLEEDEIDAGSAWRALCKTDPARALRGLLADAATDNWRQQAWRPFLWESKALHQQEDLRTIAEAMIAWPDQDFVELSDTASHWLSENASNFDDDHFWPLWDKIEGCADQIEIPVGDYDGSLGQAINHPGGRLAEALTKRLRKEQSTGSISDEILDRLTRLAESNQPHARLARVAWARNLHFLYAAIPEWTQERLLPRFEWMQDDEASQLWSARHYSGKIGSPILIEAQKEAFLALFQRPELPLQTKSRYASWLPVMLLSNVQNDAGYPISKQEARAALRSAGTNAMSSVAHRLAVAMGEGDDAERGARWRDIVGPIFKGIWPMDSELQSESATNQLVRLVLTTGDAFAEASTQITPFLRPETRHSGLTVYMIHKADDSIYQAAPESVLELTDAVVGENGPQAVYLLSNILERIMAVKPDLANRPTYQRLREMAA